MLQKSTAFGFYGRPSKCSIFLWNCQLYSGGYFFQLILKFPRSFPLDPPLAVFVHPVYHPNIYGNNTVCLDLLADKWSPSITVKEILTAISRLLDQPNPDSPANLDASDDYVKRAEKYKKKVKECCEKYHKYYQAYETE